MKKKKMQMLLIFTLLMCTATTCEGYEDDLLAFSSYPCVLTNVQLHHLDNTGDIPRLPNDEGIKKEAYLMRVELQLTSDATDEEKDPKVVPELKDGIVKVSIFTLNPFDAEHSAGSNVNDCFKEYPVLLKDHLKDITIFGDTIQICKGNSLYKALTTIPQPGVHKFRIVLSLASGKTVEQDSEPIVLN